MTGVRSLYACCLVVGLLAVPAAQAQDNSTRNLAVQSVPPPHVNDIVDLLRQPRADRAQLQERQRQLLQEPPAQATVEQRIEFLEDRALAADYLGGQARRLADLKAIVDLSRGSADESVRLYHYGLAQIFSGDARLGLQTMHEVVELLRYNRSKWGMLNNAHAMLAYLYAEMGLLDKAQEHLREARWFFGQLERYPGGYARLVPFWQMMVLLGEGRVLVAQGKWDEAEVVMRRRLELFAQLGGGSAGGRLDMNRLFEMLEQQKQFATLLSNTLGFTSLGQKVAYASKSQLPNLLFGINLGYTELARHLMRQGRFDEAELMLRDLLVANLRGAGRYSLLTAQTLTQLADLLAARGRHGDAGALLAQADEIAGAIGVGPANQIRLGLTRARLNVLVLQQDWRAAVAAQDAFEARLEARELGRLGLITPGLGIALIRSGRSADAAKRLQTLLQERLLAVGMDHLEVAEMRGVLAMALAAQGERPAARREFAAASNRLLSEGLLDVETQARGMSGLVRRLVLEAYLDFLAEEPADVQAAATAFQVADALHLGKTQQALVQSAARAAARQADLGALVRREQDSRAEQSMLYGQLLRLAALPTEQQLSQVMTAMRQRIQAIDQERGGIQATLERRFPAYSNLVRPRAATLEDARAALRPDEALLNILSTGQATYVWALRATGQVAFARAPLSQDTLQGLVRDLRKAVDPGAVDIARGLPDYDLDIAFRLFEALLKPVEPAWRGAQQLLIVTNGALGQLPLAMLTTAAPRPEAAGGVRYAAYRQVPWLVREAALTTLPSVNALVTLRRLPAGNPKRQPFIGFGDPDFSGAAREQRPPVGLRNLAVTRFTAAAPAAVPATAPPPPANWLPYSDLPPLPDTRDEVLALAQVLKASPQRDVFLGREASKARVLQANLARSRVIAFATHGLLPGEFPGVDQPALALANPGNGEHGLLTLEEILGLKLDADWVVLSACNTAAGDGSGAEAVSGLGRGFFYAGTRALLATHWPVESASARLLVTGTFERQAADPALSRAQALRLSMLALMEQQSDAGFSYAHPLFWAPYALIGDGG